jgi:replicative DNA helicase
MSSLFEQGPPVEDDAPSHAKTTSAGPGDRMPPQDVDAEQCVLGGMMLANDAIDDVGDVIKQTRDYYRPAHRWIHDAVMTLHADNEPVDPKTVAAKLRERGQLDLVGGQNYLHTCVAATPTAANAAYHAEIVRDLAVFRRLTEAGTAIAQIGYTAKDEAPQALDDAQKLLFGVADESDEADYSFVGDDLDETLDEIKARAEDGGKITGVPTGFADLDMLTQGFQGGRLIVAAGRPGVGKSTFGADVARSCAVTHDMPCVIFSLEMSRSEIKQRLLSAEGIIALHHITSGNMTKDDWTRVVEAAPRLRKAPLLIDDSPNLSVMEIRSKARRLKQKHDIRLVVVDYLQLMKAGTGQKQENRQVEVSEISRQLKLLAKELHIPVLALSQLNRGPEQRQDKRPVVSDLRESGSIENDADMVILLHRDDLYERESARAGEAELIVGKNRSGPPATITVAAQMHYSRFVDMAQS